MAAGARVRLGPGAGGHHADQPRLPVAVRASATRTPTSPTWAAGRSGPVIDELNCLDRNTASARWSSTTRCSSRTRSGCDEWIEKYPRRAQSSGPTGRPPAPTRCANGPTCSRRWSARPTGTRSRSASSRAATASSAAQQGMHRGRQLLRHRPAQPHRRRHGAARRRSRPSSGRNIMLGHPRRDARGRLQDHAHAQAHEARPAVISFYAPYPGSALGHQLIAEGKSLMSKDNYHRFPDDEKVKGDRLPVLPRPARRQVRRGGEPGTGPAEPRARRHHAGFARQGLTLDTR